MSIKIEGNWKIGYALDLHTISSEYIGVNEFGYSQYDTKRTKIGELVYNLKYKSDSSAIKELVNEIKKCILQINNFDFIIPIPPSNVNRPKQPVYLICKALSNEFSVPLLKGALKKK